MKQMFKNKKILLSVISLILVVAIGAGIFFLAPGSAEPVGVYPFMNVGMTEYWGDSQESYGPVSSDKIQTVYLTDTQTVTEILVKAGDTVKKGDVLLTFDTTLSGLELERKRLDMEKAKLQVDIAKRELLEILNMKPMGDMPDFDFTPSEPMLGEEIKAPYTPYIVSGNDGRSQETAFVCWIRDDADINDILLEELRRKVWNNAGVCEHGSLTEACGVCSPPMCKHDKVEAECDICSPEECEHGQIKALCETCSPILCRHGEVAKECRLCREDRCEHDNLKGQCNICNPRCIHGDGCGICHPKCVHGNDPDGCTTCHPPKCDHGSDPAACQECPCEHAAARKDCTTCNPPAQPEEGAGASEPVTGESLSTFGAEPYRVIFLSQTEEKPEEPKPDPGEYAYYVVFKVTEGNYQLGGTTTWQGVHVSGKGTDFALKLFNPGFADYSIPELETEETEPNLPSFDFGSGFTISQIYQMRKAKEEEIKKLEFDLKVKETDYKIMQAELEDGNVYASVDGEVLSVLTEEEARQNRQPLIKVSGGGGFYVEASISELEKSGMELGQEVTINDWNSGATYTGTIESMGDFPSNDGYWNGMGNPNTTYYPFTVFIDGSADLQTGAYVSVMYSGSSGENGIYLENPFIRTERGRSYVYVLGPGGKLERRDVVTGKSLWGSYTEILSGISETDMIAFPYGKHVKPGAPAEERDISELYSY